MPTLEHRCRELLEALDILAPNAAMRAAPLTGGVASDIARIDVDGLRLCAKFALPKLKVAQDWHAPVHRNAAEYAWLEVAARIVPEGAIRLFGRSKDLHGFAMEFLEGDGVYLWKDALLQGIAPKGEAARVADMLGRIHAASARPDFQRSGFENRDDFRALRIEPYLTFTATRHPKLNDRLTALADMLYDGSAVLVHGDVSPKNILFRGGRPVLLDAECATMGDASFDPSFCLNHLILKAVHMPELREALLNEVGAFWAAYAAHIDWENPAKLEARVSHLVPALMLARIDGKSPVEYLGAPEQAFVRDVAVELIDYPVETLGALVERVSLKSKELSK